MKLFSTLPAAALVAGLSLASPASAQSRATPEIVEIDRIVAVVNDDVIVYSEMQARLRAVVEQLGEELQGVHEQALAEAEASHEALREAWQADQPDADVVRRYAQQAMEARQAAQLAMVGGAAQAKALLTPEQQGKMQGWIDGVRMGRQMRMGRQGMRQGAHQGRLGHRQHSPWRQP